MLATGGTEHEPDNQALINHGDSVGARKDSFPAAGRRRLINERRRRGGGGVLVSVLVA